MRASLKVGGDIIMPAFRARAEVQPPIVALCDISGSMSQYSRLMLHFLHALSERRQVQTFVFGTRLTNVTRQLRLKDPDEALAGCSDAVKDWSGGTRIASALRAFNRDWSRRVLGQGATVLLITDGLEREDKGEAGADLAAEMDRLHRSCRRLIWLNPLLRYEGFAGEGARRPRSCCRMSTSSAPCIRWRRSPTWSRRFPTAGGAAPTRGVGSRRRENLEEPMSKARADLAARSGAVAHGRRPSRADPPLWRRLAPFRRAAGLSRRAGGDPGPGDARRRRGARRLVGHPRRRPFRPGRHDSFHLGDRATVHIAHDLYPTIIGDRVTVGANAVVHACTVGSDCVVGDNAVVLDGSVLEDGIVLEAGSIVFPRSKLAGGQLYAGSPAKPVRALRPGEIEERAAAIEQAILPSSDRQSVSGRSRGRAASTPASSLPPRRGSAERFAAAANSSVWFGCDLDANGGEIVVGFNTNIQDNTLIRCAPGRNFLIGANSTIGHNVTLADCRIGDRSLIGIGSVVASGTVIEDDVLLAAGSETLEGQVLERGFLWGRRPAQKMAPLDDAKRELIAQTIVMYCGYARAFAEAERQALGV